MNKKQNLNELKEGIISNLFTALGKGLKPKILKKLSNRDPKFAKLVRDVEQSRKEMDDLVQNYLDKPSGLSYRK